MKSFGVSILLLSAAFQFSAARRRNRKGEAQPGDQPGEGICNSFGFWFLTRERLRAGRQTAGISANEKWSRSQPNGGNQI